VHFKSDSYRILLPGTQQKQHTPLFKVQFIVANPGSGFLVLPAVDIRKSSQPPSGFTTADGVAPYRFSIGNNITYIIVASDFGR